MGGPVVHFRWAVLLACALAIACAVSFPARAAAAGDDTCLGCHTGGGAGDPKLDVSVDALRSSVHGSLSCTDCHSGLAGVTDFPHGPAGAPACASCHADAEKDLKQSVHGPGRPDTPRCWSCHGGHDVLPPSEAKSRVHPLNLPATCLTCHSNPALARAHRIQLREPAEQYRRSVHQRMLESGVTGAPSCSTCHGSHKVLAYEAPGSPISRANVADTCAACHGPIREQYARGVHGTAFAAGNADVPTCTGCHTEHTIKGPNDPTAPVSPLHIAQTCTSCHDDATLAGRYGFGPSRLATYLGSYHGVANKFGEATVANCASCHGAHEILPSSDPRSSINPANLSKTCGTCHPQAGRNFAQGKIHVADRPEDNYAAWLIKRMYLLMIWSIIGMFVLFILVDLWWRMRIRSRRVQP